MIMRQNTSMLRKRLRTQIEWREREVMRYTEGSNLQPAVHGQPIKQIMTMVTSQRLCRYRNVIYLKTGYQGAPLNPLTLDPWLTIELIGTTLRCFPFSVFHYSLYYLILRLFSSYTDFLLLYILFIYLFP